MLTKETSKWIDPYNIRFVSPKFAWWYIFNVPNIWLWCSLMTQSIFVLLQGPLLITNYLNSTLHALNCLRLWKIHTSVQFVTIFYVCDTLLYCTRSKTSSRGPYLTNFIPTQPLGHCHEHFAAPPLNPILHSHQLHPSSFLDVFIVPKISHEYFFSQVRIYHCYIAIFYVTNHVKRFSII